MSFLQCYAVNRNGIKTELQELMENKKNILNDLISQRNGVIYTSSCLYYYVYIIIS